MDFVRNAGVTGSSPVSGTIDKLLIYLTLEPSPMGTGPTLAPVAFRCSELEASFPISAITLSKAWTTLGNSLIL